MSISLGSRTEVGYRVDTPPSIVQIAIDPSILRLRTQTRLLYALTTLTFAFQVRQLAAVELRKRISQNSGDLWLQVAADQREQIKSKLPEIVLSESK